MVNNIKFVDFYSKFKEFTLFPIHELGQQLGLKNNIIRFKIQTVDNNLIDVYYQKNESPILVVLSYGNSQLAEEGKNNSFYRNGYSTLNWNYPGYGCSTGSPQASTIKYAADAILDFVIGNLKYSVENIVLYGYSIGCYSTSYMGSVVPNVKGIILDAPFDHIINLSPKILMKYFPRILHMLMDLYYDLDVVGNILKCHTKVKLIIKQFDEVICSESENYDTNRGINIILKIIKMKIHEKYSKFPADEICLRLEHIPNFDDKKIDTPYFFDFELPYIDQTIPDEYGDKALIKKEIEDLIEKTLKEIAVKTWCGHTPFDDDALIQTMNDILDK